MFIPIVELLIEIIYDWFLVVVELNRFVLYDSYGRKYPKIFFDKLFRNFFIISVCFNFCKCRLSFGFTDLPKKTYNPFF
jgi:hypothetical protein